MSKLGAPYLVLSPLIFGGTEYKPGAIVDLASVQWVEMKRLVENRVVERIENGKPKESERADAGFPAGDGGKSNIPSAKTSAGLAPKPEQK